MSRLNDLVPFDVNGIYVTINAAGEIGVRAALVESAKWTALFNNYYWKTQPETGMIVDWQDWGHTEYVADFIYPQSIRFSAGVFLADASGCFTGGFALHRSRTSPFYSERDRRILEVVQAHLANFHAINELLAASGAQRLPDAAALAGQYPRLTRREAEIAALICRRLRTGMIASRLMISPLTVYRHVANIFAKLNVFSRDELVEKLLGVFSGRKTRPQDGD